MLHTHPVLGFELQESNALWKRAFKQKRTPGSILKMECHLFLFHEEKVDYRDQPNNLCYKISFVYEVPFVSLRVDFYKHCFISLEENRWFLTISSNSVALINKMPIDECACVHTYQCTLHTLQRLLPVLGLWAIPRLNG